MTTTPLQLPPSSTPQHRNLAAQIAQIEKDPANVAAWTAAVQSMVALGSFDDAVAAQKQVIALSPGQAKPWNELGRIHIMRGRRADEILECFHKALQAEPTHVESRIRMGMYLLHQARLDEAGAAFAHVLKVQPDHMDARSGAALVLDRLGDPATAWQLLEQTPGPPTTSYAIAAATVALHAKVPSKAIPIVKRCRRKANALDKTLLSYSLGDLQDAAGQPAAAWRSWENGNSGRGITFDRARCDLRFEAIRQLTAKAAPQVGPRDQRPVFVVGMPRSGTTLLETLLDAHSGVQGIGESHAIVDIACRVAEIYEVSSYVQAMDRFPELGAELGAAYLEELDREAPGAIRVIDKMPNNALHLALISSILPGARVIWSERDDDDVALSCFQKSFGPGLAWASNLKGIRCWQRNLKQLKAHWQETLPLQICTVHYEDMVGDPEGEARRICAFLDIPFELGMLDFHEKRRQVATASFDQVTEAIHTRRIGRAEPYRAFLR